MWLITSFLLITRQMWSFCFISNVYDNTEVLRRQTINSRSMHCRINYSLW